MISRILKVKISAASSLNYNEDKLDLENAEVIGLNKIHDNSAEEIYRVFNKYETNIGINPATKNKGFQFVISPALYESLTEEEVNSVTRELMESLGMEEQPWVIYRHKDTGIEHYHVVSTLIRSNGTKIQLHYPYRTMAVKLKELEEKYHFKRGRDKNKENGEKYIRVDRFDLKKDNKKQFRQLYMDALAYNYADKEQFAAIMRTFNVKVTKSKHDDRLIFQGLFQDEKECTKPEGLIDYDREMYAGMMRGTDFLRKKDPNYEEKKARLNEKIVSAFVDSKDRKEFTSYLRQFNISVIFGKRHRDGTYENITYVDHGTRTAISHTEMTQTFTLKEMNGRLKEGQWKDVKKTSIERKPGQRPDTSRKYERKIRV